MLTHDQLIAAIAAEWPALVHGRDYWVGQEMQEGVQKADARIYGWKPAIPHLPDAAALQGLLTKHAAAVAAAALPPVPSEVSRWQWLKQAVADGFITSAESIAVGASGAIPARFAARVAALPQVQQDEIRLMLVTVTTVSRRNQFILGIVQPELGWTDARMDQFYRAAAALA